MHRFPSRFLIPSVAIAVVVAVIAATLIRYDAEAGAAAESPASEQRYLEAPMTIADHSAVLSRQVAQIRGVLSTRRLKLIAKLMQLQQEAADARAAADQAAAEQQAAEEEAARKAAADEQARRAAEREAQQQASAQQQVSSSTPVQAAAPQPAEQPVSSRDGVWDRLAQCETGGQWATNSVPGYSGGLGFAHSSWRDFGGNQFAPIAAQASREQQIVVAERILAAVGWRAWPACSVRLGLR